VVTYGGFKVYGSKISGHGGDILKKKTKVGSLLLKQKPSLLFNSEGCSIVGKIKTTLTERQYQR